MENPKGQILFVDDHRDTCVMVMALLGYADYEVSQAQTVAEGLRLARKGGFALILLDWVFDDRSGIELCRMIRRFDNEIPIIFYSGVAYEGEIKKAMQAGAQGFLIKPLGTVDLVDTVSHIVNPDFCKTQH